MHHWASLAPRAARAGIRLWRTGVHGRACARLAHTSRSTAPSARAAVGGVLRDVDLAAVSGVVVAVREAGVAGEAARRSIAARRGIRRGRAAGARRPARLDVSVRDARVAAAVELGRAGEAARGAVARRGRVRRCGARRAGGATRLRARVARAPVAACVEARVAREAARPLRAVWSGVSDLGADHVAPAAVRDARVQISALGAAERGCLRRAAGRAREASGVGRTEGRGGAARGVARPAMLGVREVCLAPVRGNPVAVGEARIARGDGAARTPAGREGARQRATVAGRARTAERGVVRRHAEPLATFPARRAVRSPPHLVARITCPRRRDRLRVRAARRRRELAGIVAEDGVAGAESRCGAEEPGRQGPHLRRPHGRPRARRSKTKTTPAALR
jgi:hypothetical protein